MWVDVVAAGQIEPLINRGAHRAGGFGWGDRAAGAVSLAQSILWDLLGTTSTDGVAIMFAGDVIANLPRPSFTLEEREVRNWLGAHECWRMTSLELVEHLGSIALAEPEEEAEALRGLLDRCWTERSLVN